MGTSQRRKPVPLPRVAARERIKHTAYELFSRHGTRAVGVDTIAAHAGVAKMTLYNHYGSKDELALAFLRDREERWTRAWLQAEVERRGNTSADKLLAIFDLFDEWSRRRDFEACSFTKVLLEHDDRANRVRQAAVHHIGNIRSFVAGLAREAGVDDPDAFAHQWLILMIGSIVSAYAGNREAVRHAKAAGLRLLGQS